MSSHPPPLPATKNLRLAAALNLFLPGAGLFYLGRRVAGSILALVFLGFFGTLLIIFLAGYVRYLSIAMSDTLMQGDNLEQAAQSFHQNWLIALAVGGGIVYLVSSILFAVEKRRSQS
jgi:hypothetical protein